MPIDYKVLNECYTILNETGESKDKLARIQRKLNEAGERVSPKEVIPYLAANLTQKTNIPKSDIKVTISFTEEVIDDRSKTKIAQRKQKIIEVEKSHERLSSLRATIGTERRKAAAAALTGSKESSVAQVSAIEDEIASLERDLDWASPLIAEEMREQEQQHITSLELRKNAFRKFFAQESNQQLLAEENKGKIPVIHLLDSSELDVEFVCDLIKKTPKVDTYRFKKPLLDLSSSTQSLSSSRSSSMESSEQTLAEYVVFTREIDENSSKILQEMLGMGILLPYESEKENVFIDRIYRYINKESDSRPSTSSGESQKDDGKKELRRELAKIICEYFLLEKKDPTLFFDLIRHHSKLVADKKIEKEQQVEDRPTSAFSRVRKISTSIEPSSQLGLSDEREMTEFCREILEKIMDDSDVLLGVDNVNRENLGSFLLRKKDSNNLLSALWKFFQQGDHLEVMPPEIFLNRDHSNRTMVGHAAGIPKSNLMTIIMSRIINEKGFQQWKEVASLEDQSGKSPFQTACKEGFDDGIMALFFPELLEKECVVNGKKLTPVALTIKGETIKSLQILLDLGAANVKYSNSIDSHPVAVAILAGQETALELLLEYGMDPNQPLLDNNGKTTSPLELALNEKNVKAFGVLFRYGVATKDSDGKDLHDYEERIGWQAAERITELQETYRNEKDKIQATINEKRDLATKVGKAFVDARGLVAQVKKYGRRSDAGAADKYWGYILKAANEDDLTRSVQELKKMEEGLGSRKQGAIQKQTKTRSASTTSGTTHKTPDIALLNQIKNLVVFSEPFDLQKTQEAVQELDKIEVSTPLEHQMKLYCKMSCELLSFAMGSKNFDAVSSEFASLFSAISEIDTRNITSESFKPVADQFKELEEKVRGKSQQHAPESPRRASAAYKPQQAVQPFSPAHPFNLSREGGRDVVGRNGE